MSITSNFDLRCSEILIYNGVFHSVGVEISGICTTYALKRRHFIANF